MNSKMMENLKGENFQTVITKLWHEVAPETQSFQICRMYEATHVIFTENDLRLAGEDADGLRAYELYPLHIYEETGDYYIVDDYGHQRVCFDLFIPCEYLKPIIDKKQHNPSNVTNLQKYREWKKLKDTI